MKKNIFLYKLLISLKRQGVNNIDYNSLLEIHPLFIDLLNSYNLNYYSKSFKKTKKFIFNLLLVFSQFSLGVYVNKTLTFEEDISFAEEIFDFKLPDVNDTLINEISLYLSLILKEKNSFLKKQL